MEAVAGEAATLRELLESLRAQEALVGAQEAHLTSAAKMLMKLRGQVEEVERTNDTARKREVVEALVSRVTVTTADDPAARGGKRATVAVRYAFNPSRVVALESSTAALPQSARGTLAPSWG